VSEKDIQNMINETYNQKKEDTLRGMARDFYNRKMLSSIILVWVYFLIFMGLAVYSANEFFRADNTRTQIMYAAIFTICIQMFGLVKIFAWQMIHKNSIKREIKRLEIRIAELNETVKSK
jgi:uncharacterized membrane protein YbjE (DUF340 family)